MYLSSLPPGRLVPTLIDRLNPFVAPLEAAIQSSELPLYLSGRENGGLAEKDKTHALYWRVPQPRFRIVR
jgi:hypothetical protein